MVHHVRMTSAPDFAAPWGATHHFSDLHGPVHWIHWDGPDTEEGRALDPMLLVHGLGGSHLNWLFVGQAWAKERPVYAVDLRGFGLTPGHPADTSILANRDLVVAFIEQVIGRPVVLMGNSMGGMISALVTRARPDLVRGLVLIDPALPLQKVKPDPVVAARFALFAIPGLAERAMKKARLGTPPREVAHQLIALCFADPTRIDEQMLDGAVALAAERAEGELDQGDLERSFTTAARSLMRILMNQPRYWRMLAALESPVLLLQGDQDRLVNVAAGRAAAAKNPHWTYVEFAGVGHTPQIETPDDVLKVVEAWLTEHALRTQEVDSVSASNADAGVL
jgi:pimeloyl-ACP methyl ester carboxylesterase